MTSILELSWTKEETHDISIIIAYYIKRHDYVSRAKCPRRERKYIYT